MRHCERPKSARRAVTDNVSYVAGSAVQITKLNDREVASPDIRRSPHFRLLGAGSGPSPPHAGTRRFDPNPTFTTSPAGGRIG
jgi:hypothetical protein